MPQPPPQAVVASAACISQSSQQQQQNPRPLQPIAQRAEPAESALTGLVAQAHAAQNAFQQQQQLHHWAGVVLALQQQQQQQVPAHHQQQQQQQQQQQEMQVSAAGILVCCLALPQSWCEAYSLVAHVQHARRHLDCQKEQHLVCTKQTDQLFCSDPDKQLMHRAGNRLYGDVVGATSVSPDRSLCWALLLLPAAVLAALAEDPTAATPVLLENLATPQHMRSVLRRPCWHSLVRTPRPWPS